MRFHALPTAVSCVMVAVALLHPQSSAAKDEDSRLAPKMEESLNKQINEELSSSYLYLSMTAYFESINLEGFAHWMRLQTHEENEHALKLFGYVNERNGRVALAPLQAPKSAWKSPLDAFQAAYEHEKHISASIDRLVNQARELKDHATDNFLQWFVAEQVEEEVSTYRIVQKLKLIGNDRTGLYLLDRELGERKAGKGP